MSAPEIINPPGGGGGGGTVTGSGTTGKLAKFATASSIGDSIVTELAGKIGINVVPGTLLSVGDGIVSPPSYDGIRLGNTAEALFSSSDSIRGFRAGVTGSTVVAGSTTSHDLLLQRGNVTAITLGASGAVAFAGNLTSSAAQTWTLATSTTALNIQSGLLNLDTTNSRVGINATTPATTLEAYSTATGEVRASSDVFSVVSSYTFNNTIAAFAPSIKLSRARGTRAVPVAVNALDTIGTIGWNAQGTTDHQIANIQCTAPANAGADAISSQLTFATSLTSDVLPVARMTIAPSGNVGIATPSPVAPLHVLGASQAGASIANSNPGILRIAGSATNALFVGSISDGAFGMFLQTNSTSPYPLALQPAGGNVGIGTTSPTAALDVNGSANITGALKVAGSVSRTSGSTAGVVNGAYIVVPVPETYKALLLSSTTTSNETLSSLHLIGSDAVNCNVVAIYAFQTTVANNGAASSVRITNASGGTATVKWSFLQIS